MHYRKHLIALILVLPLKLFAQNAQLENTDLTGLWKGTLYNDTTKMFYKYEIGISNSKGRLHGFSHTWFILDDKQYFGVKKVKVRIVNNKLVVEDDGLISNNYPVAPAKGVRQLNVLELSLANGMMELNGPFTTNPTKTYRPLTGSIHLERKDDYWQSALVPHLQELHLTDQLSFMDNDVVLERNNWQVAKSEKPVLKSMTLKREINSPGVQPSTTVTLAASQASVPAKKENTVVADIKQEPSRTQTVIAPTSNENRIIKDSTTNIAKQEKEEKPLNKDFKQMAKSESTPTKSAPALINKNIPAAELYTRITAVQQTVYFKTDSLQITLYDNGEVDGDTVSVVMNGNVIMAKQGLSTNAVRKMIYVDPAADSIQLVMYAENLGSIPPNTGLLVVRDGKDLYEIRFSGDLQKNAAIIFRRKKN